VQQLVQCSWCSAAGAGAAAGAAQVQQPVHQQQQQVQHKCCKCVAVGVVQLVLVQQLVQVLQMSCRLLFLLELLVFLFWGEYFIILPIIRDTIEGKASERIEYDRIHLRRSNIRKIIRRVGLMYVHIRNININVNMLCSI
jgi:hypothetical protein